MDAWSNITIASPGWRTTRKKAINFLIMGLFSNKNDPAHGEYDVVVISPTSISYLLGRTNVADPDDLRATQKQMLSYSVIPSENLATKHSDITDSDFERKTSVEKIFAMSAKQFFESFADLMVTNPPYFPQDSVINSQIL